MKPDELEILIDNSDKQHQIMGRILNLFESQDKQLQDQKKQIDLLAVLTMVVMVGMAICMWRLFS